MTRTLVLLTIGFMGLYVSAPGNQQGRWLSDEDATAKLILDGEEQWDEAACTHNKSPEVVLADDFLGTAPDGSRYGKAEEIAGTQDRARSASQCHQIGPKVRLFGDSVAMVYGEAFSIRKDAQGIEGPRCLHFTDTWLKRNGKWQVIAAHDTQYPCKR